MRDNIWLKDRMDTLWSSFFSDVERKNNIVIRFKGRWKNKFGHIKRLKNTDTEICINGVFMNERVPQEIINVTLAHEICHYAHGFNSPHEKHFKHPHQGGVVRRELINRGFKNSLIFEKKFIKEDWTKLYRELCPDKVRSLFRWF